MCGIVAIFGKNSASIEDLSNNIIHRGPDKVSKYQDTYAKIGFVRLSIIDVFGGNQPFILGDLVCVANGEIYNYKELRSAFSEDDFATQSDCEILVHLYKRHGFRFMTEVVVKGMFAFIIYDRRTREVVIGRDFMGIIPMYFGYDNVGSLYFGSELKAFDQYTTNTSIVEPGVITRFRDEMPNDSYNYYTEPWFVNEDYMPNIATDLSVLKSKFIEAVESHMMSDVNYAVLLSGGLDSSLVASIIKRKVAKGGVLTTFSIGLEGSPDLASAEKVAKYLGTKHYGFTYTIEEGHSALKNVIRHIETYDTTTIRASTPMYLLAQKIKALGFKMVLSGEGADEMFGGYLYFHKAPNREAFQKELVSKMKKLHYYDNQRANKSMLAWGVETRVPFQHRDFIDYAMNIDPSDKMCNDRIQKYILRKAFDDKENPYLPEEILWRQKEQFSDGVGYGWIDSLKRKGDEMIDDRLMQLASCVYPNNTPTTKEEFMYRNIYESLFRSDNVNFEKSVACSTASALQWEELQNNEADPSGLAVNIHDNHIYKIDD